MKNFMSYTLGPIWIFIGITSDTTWTAIPAFVAGIMFCIAGYMTWKKNNKEKEEEEHK